MESGNQNEKSICGRRGRVRDDQEKRTGRKIYGQFIGRRMEDHEQIMGEGREYDHRTHRIPSGRDRVG